jgi:hypothetical protein
MDGQVGVCFLHRRMIRWEKKMISEIADPSRHLREALTPRDPLAPTRDLFDLTPGKCLLLLDAMRLYLKGHHDHMSADDVQDCCELIAQLGTVVRP